MFPRNWRKSFGKAFYFSVREKISLNFKKFEKKLMEMEKGIDYESFQNNNILCLSSPKNTFSFHFFYKVTIKSANKKLGLNLFY